MFIARRTFNRLLAFASLGAVGCGSTDERQPAAPAPPSAAPSRPTTTSTRAGAARFLALGDSYTIGESVDASQRWPVQLVARLREAGIDVADPEIIARTGWRTDDLAAAITGPKPRGPYQLVSLLIGVNNQHRGRPVGQYEQEFPVLLRSAIALAGGDPKRVVVLSIPDWGATPFGRSADPAAVGKQIDAYNAINRAESEKAGVRYVDITPGSRLARQQPDLIAGDGLHPSAKMYAHWVKLALPEAKAALATSIDKPL